MTIHSAVAGIPDAFGTSLLIYHGRILQAAVDTASAGYLSQRETLSVGTTNSSVTTVIFPSAPCITTHIIIC